MSVKFFFCHWFVLFLCVIDTVYYFVVHFNVISAPSAQVKRMFLSIVLSIYKRCAFAHLRFCDGTDGEAVVAVVGIEATGAR